MCKKAGVSFHLWLKKMCGSFPVLPHRPTTEIVIEKNTTYERDSFLLFLHPPSAIPHNARCTFLKWMEVFFDYKCPSNSKVIDYDARYN